MDLTPVFFSHEDGLAQFQIQLQDIILCLGDSGQAGLVKIEGFESQRIKSLFPDAILKKASDVFHQILLNLKPDGILRKEDQIYFHEKEYNTAIVFLSKKRETNYYLMTEMDIFLHRLYDTFYTGLAKEIKLNLPWQEAFKISGSFLLLEPNQPLGKFITRSIIDAEKNLPYHRKKYSLRKQEIINHIIIHKEITPQFLDVMDLKSNQNVWAYSNSKFNNEVIWSKNSWATFLIAKEEGFDIELDDAAHHKILQEYSAAKHQPIVMLCCSPWAQNLTRRNLFLEKMSELYGSYPSQKILSLPLSSKSDVEGLICDLEGQGVFPSIILSMDILSNTLDIDALTCSQVKGLEIKRDLFLRTLNSQSACLILKAAIDFAFSNECEILINGIENEAEFEHAKSLGATLGVGYYIQEISRR